jgi:flagellar hook-length control protein FliK
MQTGLQSFDLSIFKASGTGQKSIPGNGKPTNDAASDQLAGFMEIMSALLALPPEQWRQSLSGLDASSADGAEAVLPNPAGNTGGHVPTADLMKLIMNMKGSVLQQLQAAKADGNPERLLNMAETLMEDPRIVALASQEAGQSRSVQGADPEALFSQGQNAAQDGLTVDNGKNGESRLFADTVTGTGKEGNPPALEIAMDVSNQSPDIPKGEKSPKTFRQPNQTNDFLFETSDAQDKDATTLNPDKTKSSLEAGIFRTPAQDNLPDEKGPTQAAEKAQQALTLDDAKNAGVNAQPRVDGENLEDRLLQKPDPSAAGNQGLLGRSVAGREPNGQSVAGVKETMPHEKAAPSDVIRQIVQRMSMQTTGDQSKMVIRLKPEFLGNVHLQVLTENHQVTVRMMADSTLVKDIVEQNLLHLRTELQNHGLEIQKFDVFVSNGDQGWRGGKEQAGFKDARNQKQSRSGGGKSSQKRGKVTFDSGSGKKIVQKDPGEIDYFA